MKIIKKGSQPTGETDESTNINVENRRPYAGSFISSYTSKKLESTDSPNRQFIKNTPQIKVNTTSRSSSIGDPLESNKERKSIVTQMNILNIKDINNSLTPSNNQNTKSTRGFNHRNSIIENETNNLNSNLINNMPTRYIPTNNEKGFTVIRSKNTKANNNYVSENIKRSGISNNSIIENTTQIEKSSTASFKESSNKDQVTILKDFSRNNSNKEQFHIKEADGKNISSNNLHNLSSGLYTQSTSKLEMPMEEKRKYLNHIGMNSNIFQNLNRKTNDHKEKEKNNSVLTSTNNLINNNLNKTAPKEKKIESKFFSNTPNEYEAIEYLKTEEYFNSIDSKGREVISEPTIIDDMKFSHPKKELYSSSKIGASAMNIEYTSNNKINLNIDIKSRVGKFYQEVLGNGPSNLQGASYSNYNSHNSHNVNITSPKNITASEKTAGDKDRRMYFVGSKVKVGNGINSTSNFQNKGMRK
jgi:hypothetical protein